MSIKSSILYCQKKNGIYQYFFANPRGCLACDSKLTPIAVEVREDHETPNPYWGWWEEKFGAFLHVYYRKICVETCFVYGYEAEEARGRGKLFPVSIHEKVVEPSKTKEESHEPQ